MPNRTTHSRSNITFQSVSQLVAPQIRQKLSPPRDKSSLQRRPGGCAKARCDGVPMVEPPSHSLVEGGGCSKEFAGLAVETSSQVLALCVVRWCDASVLQQVKNFGRIRPCENQNCEMWFCPTKAIPALQTSFHRHAYQSPATRFGESGSVVRFARPSGKRLASFGGKAYRTASECSDQHMIFRRKRTGAAQDWNPEWKRRLLGVARTLEDRAIVTGKCSTAWRPLDSRRAPSTTTPRRLVPSTPRGRGQRPRSIGLRGWRAAQLHRQDNPV
ncbi:hypothetical protein DFJ73DRAFT_842920, partial [Zopfochytrium polystomum]